MGYTDGRLLKEFLSIVDNVLEWEIVYMIVFLSK